MSISERDLKLLWWLAAGRCSKPGCPEECIKFLRAGEPTILGEMAHVIARKPGGPRGKPGSGEDSYDNLILLCPSHHAEIDKAPQGVYTIDTLLEWKRAHESRVRNSFNVQRFESLRELAIAV